MSGSPFGILEYFTGKEESETTKEVAGKSSDIQWGMYSQTRVDQLPLIESGQKAINQLSTMTGEGGYLIDPNRYGVSNYEESDYNKWLKQQGVNAILAGGSATGNLGSGNIGTSLVNYAENVAGSGFNDWYNRMMSTDTAIYNRLMGIVSPAQTAAATVGSVGMNTASSTANNNLYAQMLANQYNNQGLAALGSSSGQIGNQIIGGINAYNKNNYLYNQQQQQQWNDYLGSDSYNQLADTQSYGWGAYN